MSDTLNLRLPPDVRAMLDAVCEAVGPAMPRHRVAVLALARGLDGLAGDPSALFRVALAPRPPRARGAAPEVQPPEDQAPEPTAPPRPVEASAAPSTSPADVPPAQPAPAQHQAPKPAGRTLFELVAPQANAPPPSYSTGGRIASERYEEGDEEGDGDEGDESPRRKGKRHSLTDADRAQLGAAISAAFAVKGPDGAPTSGRALAALASKYGTHVAPNVLTAWHKAFREGRTKALGRGTFDAIMRACKELTEGAG